MQSRSVLVVRVAVILALGAGGVTSASAQGPLVSKGLPVPAPPLSVSFGAGTRVTLAPGMARCRMLLADLARLTHMQIRNLDRVPDDAVYVGFSGEPLGSVVGKILGYARVDFLLRGAYGPEPALLIVSGPSSASVSAGSPVSTTTRASLPPEVSSQDLPVPPPVYLPDLDQPTGEDGAPRLVPLNVRPEVVEIPNAPMWQPVDDVSVPLTAPVDMVPKPFAVPVTPGAPLQPGPLPTIPKRQ